MPLWGKTDSSSSMPKSVTGGVDNVLFEDMSSVYADAERGVADASNRPGWYFTNPVKGKKINWYFFSNSQATVKLGEVSYYALITVDSLVDRPFLAFYTVKEGAGDAGSWYRSRVVSSTPNTVTVGTKYLVHVGPVPDTLFAGIPRITPVNTSSTIGPRGANEIVLTIAIGSNSAANAGAVKFVCEAAGVISPNYTKNSLFRIRSTYNPETDAGAVSEIVPQKAANLYLVDPQEADLAKEKGITSSGWWTYTTYTTSSGRVRHKAECLVPMKVDRDESGDRGADDVVLPNGKITITTQPESAIVESGDTFTFSVVANADGAAMNYQWQESANGTTFTNIAGATSSSYSAVATALKDGYRYKVVVTSSGLVSATSNVATLSVE